jgi:CarD family transcriptional regulator
MTETHQYAVGNWVVHTHYGVGQIKKIEKKPIQGEIAECFKVKTKDCTFWFPKEPTENPRIRLVASQDIIDKVIKNLRRKPGNFEKDKKYWENQIKVTRSNGDLLSVSQLVRDLSAQHSHKRLNHTQEKALSEFKDRLLSEMVAITGSNIESIRKQLQEWLQESLAKIPVND